MPWSRGAPFGAWHTNVVTGATGPRTAPAGRPLARCADRFGSQFDAQGGCEPGPGGQTPDGPDRQRSRVRVRPLARGREGVGPDQGGRSLPTTVRAGRIRPIGPPG